MDFTMKQLKGIAQNIADNFGLDIVSASQVVGYYNASDNANHDIIRDMLDGDFSSVPSAMDALGIKSSLAADIDLKKQSEKNTACTPSEKTTKAKKSCIKQKNTSQDIDSDISDDNHLPVGFIDDINTWISEYCQNYNIDINKIDNHQWRACCMYIGQHIKSLGILRDREREAHEGGRIYSTTKMLELLQLFDYICATYKQVAFTFLFQRFSGISRQYFNDYMERGLTSSCVQLKEKATKVQNESIMTGIASGGSKAIPMMFLGKSVVGLRETAPALPEPSTIVVSLSDMPNLAELPSK